MFFGRFDYQIDAKGRFNFPAKFRAQMEGDGFVVMQWIDHCLFVLSYEEIEKLSERVGGDELMSSWETTGDLFSTAVDVTPDKQGRIILPSYLRDYANLTKDVTIIGNRSHAEIWDTATWDARRNAKTNAARKAGLIDVHA